MHHIISFIEYNYGLQEFKNKNLKILMIFLQRQSSQHSEAEWSSLAGVMGGMMPSTTAGATTADIIELEHRLLEQRIKQQQRQAEEDNRWLASEENLLVS